MWIMLPLSPQAAAKLAGLVLLWRVSDAAMLGSALKAPFSHLAVEPRSLSFQLPACLRKGEGREVPTSQKPWCPWGRGQWLLLPLLPPYEILAELAVPGASMFFRRESFVLLTSCAGFRRPPGLPWQQFLLKYRWECKLILNKVKWRRGWKKALTKHLRLQSIWGYTDLPNQFF